MQDPPKRTRRPTMRVGCEGRPTVAASVAVEPSPPATPEMSRADLIDRVVRSSIVTSSADDGAAAGAVHPARLAIALSFANQLAGVRPPLEAAEVEARAAQVQRWRLQLAELLVRPGIAQRTPEWYEARHSLITASDAAQALGCAKFGNQRQFFQKKCGLPEEQAPFDAEVPPLKWGVMFEPVAQAIYSAAAGGTRVHEFGLLRHPHLAHVGASPDGITELGVMLEIKCPWRRKIVEGDVPMQYYHQIQAQLAVCGLDECDYFECEFDEDEGPEGARWRGEPTPAFGEGADAPLRRFMPFERGVFVEVAVPPTPSADGIGSSGSSGSSIKTFAYPEPAAGLPAEALADWLAAQRAKAAADGATGFWPHWWVLRKRSTTRVAFDAAFSDDMFARLGEVWGAVLAYRADRGRYESEVGVATPPAPRVRGIPDFPDEEEEGMEGGKGRADPFATFAFVD